MEKCEECKGTGKICCCCGKSSKSCKCDDREQDLRDCPDCKGTGQCDDPRAS